MVMVAKADIAGPGAIRAPRLDQRRREWVVAYGFLAPAAVTVLALVVYPLYRVIDISFREGKSMNFARIGELPLGFGNYRRIFGDPAFWNSVIVSAIYVGLSVFVAFAIALATALLLNRDLPFRRFFRTVILLPWAVPGVIASIIFMWMFDGSFGVINALLRALHITAADPAWFIDRHTAIFAVTFPTIWKAYPLIVLLLLAGMQTIPAHLYEAAKIDGANPRQEFLYITWPGIQPSAILAVMISALWIFSDLDIIYAATRGGPSRTTETLSVYVYNEGFQYFRMGSAAAAGTLMVTGAFVLAVLSVAFFRRRQF